MTAYNYRPLRPRLSSRKRCLGRPVSFATKTGSGSPKDKNFFARPKSRGGVRFFNSVWARCDWYVRCDSNSEVPRDSVAFERSTESFYIDEGIDLIPAPVFV